MGAGLNVFCYMECNHVTNQISTDQVLIYTKIIICYYAKQKYY